MKKKNKPEKKQELGSALGIIFCLIGISFFVYQLSHKNTSSDGQAQISLAERIQSWYSSLRSNEGPNIPTGKSAKFYLLLGLQYKDKGWVEASRICLMKAARMEPDSMTGHSAEVFLAVAIPKYKVTQDAINANIDGFNLQSSGDYGEAETKFLQLIKDNPKFEWPYGNLASMYITMNRLKDAEPLIDKALDINGCYVNGLLYKMQILNQQHKVAEVKRVQREILSCLGPRSKLDPVVLSLYEDLFQATESN